MRRLVKASCTAAALIIVAIGATVAAPPGAPVEAGFNGTKFRGVALGQSRAEVEAALAAIGRRCLTNADIAAVRTPDGAPINSLDSGSYIEVAGGYTACRIVRDDFVPEPTHSFTRLVESDIEQKIGAPLNAVSFVNDVATVIVVDPSFFNAQGTADAFAQSIATNYAFARPLEWHGSGWLGYTPQGERVNVAYILNRRGIVLYINRVSPDNLPSFD